jgi:hypothetical protein
MPVRNLSLSSKQDAIFHEGGWGYSYTQEASRGTVLRANSVLCCHLKPADKMHSSFSDLSEILQQKWWSSAFSVHGTNWRQTFICKYLILCGSTLVRDFFVIPSYVPQYHQLIRANLFSGEGFFLIVLGYSVLCKLRNPGLKTPLW